MTAQVETELKWPILDRAAFAARVRSLQGHSFGPMHELNIWYSNGKDARRLRIARPHLLHRGGPYTYCITKKGPNQDSTFKVTLEDNFYALHFGSPQKAIDFFSDFMDWTEQFRYERIRRDFQLNSAPVFLSYDEMPLIGDYLEIEGSEEGIEQGAKMLGLKIKDASNASYKALFKAWKHAHPESNAKGLLWEGDKHFLARV